jgi:hypothetical protein
VLQKVKTLENSDVYISFKTNGTVCKIHAGWPVCYLQSKMIWLILSCTQGTVVFRSAPVWFVTSHVVFSHHSGKNCLRCETQLLGTSLREWACLIVWLLTLHRNTPRKLRKSPTISSNSQGQKFLGEIHAASLIWIRPLFLFLFIPTRCLKPKAQGPSMFMHLPCIQSA